MNLTPNKQDHSAASGACVLTQRQVAVRLGISQTRVRQLETRALRKLRLAIEDDARASGQTLREWISKDFS